METKLCPFLKVIEKKYQGEISFEQFRPCQSDECMAWNEELGICNICGNKNFML